MQILLQYILLHFNVLTVLKLLKFSWVVCSQHCWVFFHLVNGTCIDGLETVLREERVCHVPFGSFLIHSLFIP